MLNIQVNDYDRFVYETELKDFLPDRIVDCHTHLKAKEFINVGAPTGSSWVRRVFENMDGADLIEAYQKMLPGKKVEPVVFGDCTHPIDEVNRFVEQECAIYHFPKLYRISHDIPADELEERVKKGGYLGLKPYQNFRPLYIPANKIRIFDFLPKEHLEVADKNGWIIMLHTPGEGRLKDSIDLAQVMEIEEKYPNVRLIVAHIGRAYAPEDIGDAFEILKNTKNLRFDFTANMCDEAIKGCIEAVGSRRLLFGTDMPVTIMRMYRITENGVYYNVVPRGLYGDMTGVAHMRETDETEVTFMMYEQLRSLKRVAADLKLSDRDIENIMYTNAKEFFV